MISTFLKSFAITFTQNANSLIYFLRRIPFIGKKIPESLYKSTNVKIGIGVIKEILDTLGAFVFRALYIVLMIFLPASFIVKSTNISIGGEFLHIFFFLSFIFGSFMNVTVFDSNNKSAYDMIVLMRTNAKDYYVGKIIYRKVLEFIYFLVPMVIVGLIIGINPTNISKLLIELTAFRFMGEMFHLLVYDRTKKILSKSNVFTWFMIIGCLALAYILPIFKYTINFEQILFNNLVMLIIAVLGIFSYTYINKYNKYTEVSKKILTKESLLNVDKIIADANFADVKIDEKTMSKQHLNDKKYESKQGYAYLNTIFFDRNRKILLNPMITMVVSIAVLFFIISCMVMFIPQSKADVFNVLINSTPAFVFVMYAISTGERICKSFFYNCDVSFLKYGYYRSGKVILSNFTYRLKMSILLNIIPAFELCLAIIGITILSGNASQLLILIPLILCIISLSCFFSIHHLFMYYVIQPYTTELTVKSPLYTFIHMFVYIVCYECLQIKTASYYFTAGVLTVTIIYMLIALVTTYKVAPKTFKLK